MSQSEEQPTSNRRRSPAVIPACSAISRSPSHPHCHENGVPAPWECGAPRLLVSVRDAGEAQAALAGGCDIVDVKEPNRGSLGMASSEALTAVIKAITTGRRRVPVSAALGEVRDWEFSAPDVPLPAGLSYVKLGLAGLGGDPDWAGRWRTVRRNFHHGSSAAFRWIAVSYADWQSADAPDPASVVTAALEETDEDLRCAGVLLDTFSKDGQTLADCLPPVELTRLAQAARAGGLFLALAGSLQQAMLPQLRSVHPDIVAIRTAACTGLDRTATVDARAVATFRQALTQTFGDSEKPPCTLSSETNASAPASFRNEFSVARMDGPTDR